MHWVDEAQSELDPESVETFAERVLGDYAGANAIFMAGIGDRLELFKELADGQPVSSLELASRTGLQERYLREWLAGMAAAGYLAYDSRDGRYLIPGAHVPVLAEEAGVHFLGAAFFDFSTNFGDTFRQLVDAFRHGGGVPRQAFGEEYGESTERFTAPWFEHQLVPVWIPAMPDVRAALEAGVAVCDVGCGRGRALLRLAEHFPRCEFVGVDIDESAVRYARAAATEAGVGDRVHYETGDACDGLRGHYDLVTTSDVVHDAADPVGLMRAVHDALEPTGRYVCVDVNCAEHPEGNAGALGTVLYGLSLANCMTVSLASGGAGLGALGLPPGRLGELARQAGFAQVRQVPIDDPFNNLYEITP